MILVDAEIAFNKLKRKLTSNNMQYMCPQFAIVLINTLDRRAYMSSRGLYSHFSLCPFYASRLSFWYKKRAKRAMRVAASSMSEVSTNSSGSTGDPSTGSAEKSFKFLLYQDHFGASWTPFSWNIWSVNKQLYYTSEITGKMTNLIKTERQTGQISGIVMSYYG